MSREKDRKTAAQDHIDRIEEIVGGVMSGVGVRSSVWRFVLRPFGIEYLIGGARYFEALSPVWGENAVREHARAVAERLRQRDVGLPSPQLDLVEYINNHAPERI